MGLTANRAVTAEALNPDGESEVAETTETVKATTTKKTTKSSTTTK